MILKTLILVVGIHVFLSQQTETSKVENEDLKMDNDLKYGNDGLDLIYLGTVEGKVYFTHNEETLTYNESLTYCRGLGMTLGSITSENEISFLRKAFDYNAFNGMFWTAGKEQQNIDPGTGTENKANLTCVIYETNDYRFEIRDCSENHFTLCETPSGKQFTLSTSKPTRPTATAQAGRITFSFLQTFSFLLLAYIIKIH